MTTPEEERRAQEAMQRHVCTRAFGEAEDVISAVLSDLGVQEARAGVEVAEMELGMELCARLQPFQDRYDQVVAEGDAAQLAGGCAGKHGRWGRICVLPRRTRDLDAGTALGPQQRRPADRVGGQRTRRLVSSGGESGDRTPGPKEAARGPSLSGASGTTPRPYTR